MHADETSALASSYSEYYRRHRPRILEQRAHKRAGQFGVARLRLDYVALHERDLGRCYLCGQAVPLEVASWDHVVPLASGGPHIDENVRTAHVLCNARKSNADLDSLAAD
jgi:hypothetical protein